MKLANRRSRRVPVLLTANLLVADQSYLVKLRNFSEDGVLIEADQLPTEGAIATFKRNGVSVKSTVVWVEGRFAGVKFDRPLSSENVLRHVPRPRVLQPVVFRRPGIACRPLTVLERKLVAQWMPDVRLRPED